MSITVLIKIVIKLNHLTTWSSSWKQSSLIKTCPLYHSQLKLVLSWPSWLR